MHPTWSSLPRELRKRTQYLRILNYVDHLFAFVCIPIFLASVYLNYLGLLPIQATLCALAMVIPNVLCSEYSKRCESVEIQYRIETVRQWVLCPAISCAALLTFTQPFANFWYYSFLCSLGFSTLLLPLKPAIARLSWVYAFWLASLHLGALAITHKLPSPLADLTPWLKASLNLICTVSVSFLVKNLIRQSDLLERKSQQITLNQSKLTEAQKISRIGSFTWEFATKKSHWSEELYAIFGYEPFEIPAEHHTFKKMLHPDDVESYASKFQETVQGKAVSEHEFRIFDRHGKLRYVRACRKAIRNEAGEAVGIMGTLQDLTEFKEMEIARDESDAVLRALIDALPSAVCYIDRNRNYRFTNAAYRRFLSGQNYTKVQQSDLNSVFGVESAEAILQCRENALNGIDSNIQVFLKAAPEDKAERSFEVRYIPFKSSEDEICGIIGMVTDVTERVNRERAIRESEARLVAASKMSALGEMSAGVAHEINNPLSIIHGRAEMLKNMAQEGRLDPAKVAATAEKIEATAIRISRIVKSMRTFAREGSKDPIESVTLGKILEETLELCEQRLKTREIEIVFAPGIEDLRFEARPGQIAQVVLNLLNNAFDAIQALPEKWVRIDAKETAAGEIEIRIKDSGRGITKEIEERIFQPFFTTKEVGKGTGLGLSVSKGIVESHGGKLRLDRGEANTCFVIQLPKIQPDSATAASKAA